MDYYNLNSMEFSIEQLYHGILKGDRRSLARGITLIESVHPTHRVLADQLLDKIAPRAGNSLRIGITGVPGAGKSTFIEQFGMSAIQKGHKVAVLAVDPSSNINKGSLLGDKTRMELLSREEKAFIRPSPTSGFLGGVANATFETMLLCEAAGYDIVLIETVGVGQSEVMVSQMCDVFLLLSLIGAGDELQGIKKGIMEMVDIIFINKVVESNLQAARKARAELIHALQFLRRENTWKVPVLLGSALNEKDVLNVWKSVEEFSSHKKDEGFFYEHRKRQAEDRFEFWVNNLIIDKAKQSNALSENFDKQRAKASSMLTNPSSQARRFVEELFRDL